MLRVLLRSQQSLKSSFLTIPQYYSTKQPPIRSSNHKKNKNQENPIILKDNPIILKDKLIILNDKPISTELYHQTIIQNEKKHNPDGIPEYIKRKRTFQKKHGNTAWNPKRRLSREDMEKLRQLKEIFPHYKTIDLSQIFHISPEAVRRILKSKFQKD